MLIYLILLFTLVPVIELTLLLKVGQFIGVVNTIAIVIITGITGAFLAKLQGLRILDKVSADINQGKMPADKLFDGVLILCSGLLLLTPGFLTDLIGFAGLIPFTRGLFKTLLKRKIKNIIAEGKIITLASFRSR